MKKAADAGKDIVCTIPMGDAVRDEISTYCSLKGVIFAYHNNLMQSNSYNVRTDLESLNTINVPVIFVLGVAERVHKFEIQLSLRESFLKKGYKVSQVGTRSYCELLGFHSFPAFMYSRALNETEKIVHFNAYIKHLEVTEQPDVIMIGVPGGIMPFNNTFTNRFGVLAYEISQAVVPDAAVVGVLYEDYKPEYFDMMVNMVKSRLDVSIDCFNLSNIMFDYNTSEMTKFMTYTSIASAFVDEKKRNFISLDTPVFNILNKDDSSTMADYLVDGLAGREEVECV